MLLVKSGGAAAVADWQAAFREFAPDLDVRWWDDPTIDPAAVRYVLVWDPEPGRLAKLPNLRVIFGSGAGVDLIVRDPGLPPRPIVRCVPPEATQRMGEFVCWTVLSLLKDARRMAIGQAKAHWDYFEMPFNAIEKTVGIMGLGAMGRRAAEMLRGLGFPVVAWSRTRKAMDGVTCYAGEDERDAFLARSDVLVCLLPATPATEGVIAEPLIAKLPPGAALVNVGRGSQQKLDDILRALDSGHLSGAALDVFEPEPLPDGNPVWWHPRLIVTPHVASTPSRRDRARYVAALIAAHERGEALPNLYDAARGY